MASSGKRKTTMAKLNRERRLLEQRFEKQARKDARKQAAETSRPDRRHADRHRRLARQGAGDLRLEGIHHRRVELVLAPAT